MKHYPSIPKDIRPDLYIWAFAKLDGSQIRAEWNSKKGFYKFGTRNHLLDPNDKTFGKAIPLIKDKYENDLAKIFKEQNWKDAICFFEFYGPNSFAGQHDQSEEQTVILFDVNPYKQGILPPDQFIKLFGGLDIPKVLYEGQITSEFIDAVKDSSLADMPLEGVVCKGVDNKLPVFFKVKSRAWLGKLKAYCGDNEQLYKLLE